MMKIRLICFGLILNCFIYLTYAQHFECNSVNGYNTKDLTSAIQWQVTTEDQCLSNLAAECSFYISFCHQAPMCFNEYSACQNGTGTTNVTIIGGYNSTLFYPYENGKIGFYAKFPNGPTQNISNTTRCEPSLIINFNCNTKVKWFAPLFNATASAPQPTDIDIDQCKTTLTFDYDGACFNGQEPSNGLSGGAVFLIILFSVTFVYMVGGLLYNGFVQHKSGLNLLPHAQFWIGLPLYAIEGCRTSLGLCSCSSTPSQATYESV
ncbi:unnamed protein product [Rotaria sp. Silwood1]|nr:unnamed protein product [Rotaria sp. Silwood1]CAF1582134.1 unnamed protein product [Rotaria sp. Silwood1]CAF3641184.1 unnamed protein product [Rotaria sp. Silwood1]CAF4673438.1 unnamed protein product [Rotaria sp. Silwood1]CAF4764193.1 unnamed protein product [Rotaria sp. Silwood1]